jgi:putative ABC transport system permease protein
VSAFVAPRSPHGFAMALRFALRELRGGLRGFYVFLACIALGAMTIAGVNSVSRAMIDGIAAEGQTILGGDLAFSLVHRETGAEEAAFLDGLGRVSRVATLRAMARKPDSVDQALVELKAVDGAYPLYGAMALAGGMPLEQALARSGEAYGGAADPELLARLGLSAGDVVMVGRAAVRIAAAIELEPDRVGGRIGFGPRLMVGQEALAASGLVQPGSLVRWHYRIRMDDTGVASLGEVNRAIARAESAFPNAGWRIRSRANAAPGLQRQIDRFTEFLTLVGLTALIVGGVGVANAVRAFLDSKRPVIATFKCLGAPGGFVFRVYLIQILVLAVAGIAVGLALGAVAPLGAGALLDRILPIGEHVTVYPQALGLAAVYGLMTALAFSIWPLGRAHDVAPTALFRERLGDERVLPRWPYLAATIAAVAGLAVLAVAFSEDRRISLIYVVATAGAFLLLRLVSVGVMDLARRLPRPKRTEARLALTNIHRPGALTPSVVLSLGLGLALLVALAQIDGNLRHQLTSSLPDRAPSFFFVDIQNHEIEAFEDFLRREAEGAQIQRVPMLRGRMVSIAGVPVEEIEPAPDAAWALRGDRGITYSRDLPENSELVAGQWWPPDHAGEPLVSFEDEIARGLGLAIGDTVTVNVLGREISARVANIRRVAWESLSINFVMVFSPNTFAGAPHTHLATITWPGETSLDREMALLRAVTAGFPTVTSVRVKDALDAVNALVGQIAAAVRVAASVALVASVLVLAGALAAGHRYRIYDAVILKTLGATRRTLIAAFTLEYALIGLATAVFALFAGGIAAWFVVSRIMTLPSSFLPEVAVATIAAALVFTVGFGLIGTWRVLGHKAAPVLRNL